MTATKRQAILVLGMHRSGTSAIGGVINALGVSAPKTLFGPGPHNQRGFFESYPLILALNDMLAAAGSSWHDWRRLDAQWLNSPAAEQYRAKIKALLNDEFGDAPLIFIKDPRICRCLPFLSSILTELDIGTVALLPVRNPLEVAHSLERRDGFALSRSFLLWLRHLLDAEYHSRHMPRYFLPYELFLLDWRTQLERAAERIGIAWPTAFESADAEVARFLTPDLYHERSTLDEVRRHPSVTPMVMATYDILTTMATAGESRDLLERLDAIRSRFDEGCALFGAVVAAEERAARELRGQLSVHAAEIEQLGEAKSKLQEALGHKLPSAEHIHLGAEHDALGRAHTSLVDDYNALVRAHLALVAERDGLVQARASLDASFAALGHAHTDLVGDYDALARAHVALVAEGERLIGAQASLRAERDALSRNNASLVAKCDRLLRERDTAARDRDALLSSHSWQITAPLRSLAKLFGSHHRKNATA